MNRQEYLQRLYEALRDLPQDTWKAALEFYAEMIDDRMEDGMDEASAVAAMEAPEAIAARLRAEAAPGETPGEGEKQADGGAEGPSPLPPFADEAMEFSTLAERVLRSTSQALESVPGMVDAAVRQGQRAVTRPADEDEAEAMAREADAIRAEAARIRAEAKQIQAEAEAEAKRIQDEAEADIRDAMQEARQAQESAEGLRDAIQEARKARDEAAENGGVHIVFGDKASGDYERREFTFPADQLRAVRLLINDLPIRVKPAPGGEAKLLYYVSKRALYAARLENGVLTLQNPEKAAGRGEFSWSLLGGIFRISWYQQAPTVELFLPADALVDLTAQTTNGSIKCEGFTALCDVKLTTTNSRIVLENAACKALELTSSNGRLVLKNVACKQLLQGKTSNSRIEAEGVRGQDAVELRTSNGRIQADDVTARQGIELRTSNSPIVVSNLSAPAVTLKTSNSAISGVMPGSQRDWTIDSGTSNGRNSLPKAQSGGSRALSAHTSNGSISLSFQADGR